MYGCRGGKPNQTKPAGRTTLYTLCVSVQLEKHLSAVRVSPSLLCKPCSIINLQWQKKMMLMNYTSKNECVGGEGGEGGYHWHGSGEKRALYARLQTQAGGARGRRRRRREKEKKKNNEGIILRELIIYICLLSHVPNSAILTQSVFINCFCSVLNRFQEAKRCCVHSQGNHWDCTLPALPGNGAPLNIFP